MKFLFQEALEHLDLEAWLEQYVQLKDGGGAERRIAICPRCGDDRYKLYLNVEMRVWLCYVCDWGRGKGDIVELMAGVSGRHETQIRIELGSMVVPATPQANFMQELRERLAGPAPPAIEIQDPVAVDVPGQGFTGMWTQPIYNYALSRGLTPEQVTSLGLQAALKVPTKTSEVRGPWLVFPVCVADKNVAWQGRRLVDKTSIKYLSSDSIHDWLWPLNEHFFSVYKPGMPIVLVEGVFDALGLLRYKVAALCTFGKSLSNKQLLILREMQASELIFMWDADAFDETFRAVDRVIAVFPKVSFTVTRRTDGKKTDAGDALKDPTVVPWLSTIIKGRLDVRSPEFFQWRIQTQMGQ